MGRQGGIARFLGTCGDINGYADDGRAIWRVKSSLDKKKWLRLPSMAGQREAARLFSSASVIAGNLWRRLPVGMRRLADGGGFNTLVGQCRILVDDGADSSGLIGQIVDVDGLRGLDLSADSSGPHSIIKNEELRMKKRQFDAVNGGSGRSACANCLRELRLKDSVSVHRTSFRLTGVRELMEQIDLAVGNRAGQRSGKYVVAAGLNPWVVKETVDWEKLGRIEDWSVKSEHCGDSVCGSVSKECAVSPQRRVRVWVHAVELVETECRAGEKYFKLVWGQRQHHSGFVTPWVVQDCSVVNFQGSLRTHVSDWAEDYAIEDGELQLLGPAAKGTGVYVVFTAVEVAEKRGRHWVRLPWCSKMRVCDVVEVSSEQVAVSSEPVAVSRRRDGHLVGGAQPAGSEARLVAQRVEKEIDDCREATWDFIAYSSSGRDREVVIEFKLAFRRVVKRMDRVIWGMRAGP